MEEPKKILKLNRDIKINAATVIIFFVLVYVLISLFRYFSKDTITIYKVSKSNISNNISLNGLAIREETIVRASKSGYVCYYIRDGEKVKNTSTVCTIDETGQLYSAISNTEDYDSLLTAEDYKEIRSTISLYKSGYSNNEFYTAYNFENTINNKVLELTNEIIMQQVSNSQGQGSTLSRVIASTSGVVTYYIDGYEDYNFANIKASDFDQSTYSKETLKTGDVVSSGNPIVKIVPSESWNIIAPITQDQIAALSEKKRVSFYINNSNFVIRMPFEIIQGADGSYINIKLDKYLTNFLSERFVNVEILMDEDSGLKIPVSSVVEKDVYKIPITYLNAGGNQSNSNRIYVKVKLEDGTTSLKPIVPTIYKTDEEYCYVDPSNFHDGDVIVNINSSMTTAVSLLYTETLQGVYVANQGIAEFRMINIIKTVDEFSLIENDENVSAFDNIILDAASVEEGQMIY